MRGVCVTYVSVIFICNNRALTFGKKEGARKDSSLTFCLKFSKFNGRRRFVSFDERPASNHCKHC